MFAEDVDKLGLNLLGVVGPELDHDSVDGGVDGQHMALVECRLESDVGSNLLAEALLEHVLGPVFPFCEKRKACRRNQCKLDREEVVEG